MMKVMKVDCYGRYKKVRNAAWQTLIDFEIRSLPVSVLEIARKANIKVIENKDCNLLEDRQSGLSINMNGSWYIVYNDLESDERIRFTVAHELGHIFLGHASLLNRNTSMKEKPQEEKEADMFAIRLLSPACVLWGLNLHTAEEIASVCQISLTAAKYRSERMKTLYERNMFLTNPIERKVYKRLKKYIKQKNQ